METHNKIIGIIIFFSDVRQPNEASKDWKKEKCGKLKLWNHLTDIASGLATDFSFFAPLSWNPIWMNYAGLLLILERDEFKLIAYVSGVYRTHTNNTVVQVTKISIIH